jgi:biopolymer transport protein ExbB
MFEHLISGLITAYDYFEKGGILSWPILACSLVAAAAIIERVWVYRAAFRSDVEWMDGFMAKVGKGNLPAAAAIISGVDSPSARVLRPMLERVISTGRCTRSTLEKIANHYGNQEVRELERRLPTLATIGNVAPLLGLMGTVMGMVKAFMQIQAMGGKVNASVLAGGIWEALLTTLFGLAVAIPAVIAHNYLSARVSGFAGRIQDQAMELMEGLEEAVGSGETSGAGRP